MASIRLTDRVHAPLDRVFAVYSDFARCADRVSGIERVEFLTEGPVGKGTRFRETRIMFRREATEEMEVTAFDPPHSYTLSANTCGCEFHSTFRFTAADEHTNIEVEIQTKSVTFFARLMSPLSFLMSGSMKKCVQKDLDDLRAFVEPTAAERQQAQTA